MPRRNHHARPRPEPEPIEAFYMPQNPTFALFIEAIRDDRRRMSR